MIVPDSRVLIPREDTYSIAVAASVHIPELDCNKPLKVVDLGCGSGVLGLSFLDVLRRRSLHDGDIDSMYASTLQPCTMFEHC